ncbi:CHAT domain-containing protein [Actinomycetospora sp. SF1]|nr:CHAT domain-containing protein [Actinomycetospora soli]
MTFSDLAELGDPAARDEDIRAAREAVRRSTPHGDHRVDALTHLAEALLERYRATRSREDLDELIVVNHQLLTACPEDDHERRRTIHGVLGESHQERAELADSSADLEATIRHHRLGLECTPADHDEYPRAVILLASALVDRGVDSGSLPHLREAVSLCERLALLDLPAEESYLRHRVTGRALQALSFEIDDDTLTERALQHHRAAVRLAPHAERDPDEPAVLLASALIDAYGRLLPDHPDLDHGRPVDAQVAALVPRRARDRLDESIAVCTGLVAGDPEPDVVAVARTTLADGLRHRFILDGDPSDLEEALHQAKAAVAVEGIDAAWLAGPRSTWASCLRSRFATDGDREAAEDACELWQLLVTDPAFELEGQLLCAVSGLDTALSAGLDPGLALEAAESAIDRLTRLAGPGTARDDAERRLGRWTQVAAQAAEAALRANRPERALELVEQGRAVLWNAQLDIQSDVEDVRRLRPDLAVELEERRTELAALSGGTTSETDSATAEARMVAGRRLDEVVAQTREAGFSTVTSPPSEGELRAHAWRGPVAVLTTTESGGRALLIRSDAIDVVDLPELVFSETVARTNGYTAALYREGEPDEAALRATHAWLWRAAARPVLDRLGPGTDRVWWCPTGPLTLLPLHAAGDVDGSVSTRIVSSYTATVRSLSRTDRTPPSRQEALFVGMHRTPGHPDLAGVADERASLQAVLGVDAVTVIEDEGADLATVAAAWSHHDVVHFSGHGVQDGESPSEGGLVLHDGVLTVARLADLPSGCGRLAVLSACQSATGGTVNADEAIAVASALQYGGWDSVVGTLWPVRDDVAAAVSRSIHRDVLGARGDPPHLAMHHAVRRQRALHPDRPSLWAPFVHVGT